MNILKRTEQVTNNLNRIIAKLRTVNKDTDNNSFAANQPPLVQPTTVTEILDTVRSNYHYNNIRGQSIAVLYTIEFAVALHSIGHQNVTVLTKDFCKVTKHIANDLGFKYNTINEAINMRMKFDIVIGNPPYNQGILKDTDIDQKWLEGTGGYPHLAIFNISQTLVKENGLISMLMPATLMTLISTDKWRRKVLKEGNVKEIKLLDNRKKEVFNIGVLWVCNVIYIAGEDYTTTKYVAGDSEVDANLLDYNYIDRAKNVTTWPMFYDLTVKSIFEKVRSKALPLQRGQKEDAEKVPSISYMLQGVPDNPVVNGTPQAKDGSGDLNGLGHILFDTDQEANKYCDFMKSDVYQLMISVTKSGFKTQPQFIVQIGGFDFSNIDVANANELYTFFDFTDEEVVRIKNHVQ